MIVNHDFDSGNFAKQDDQPANVNKQNSKSPRIRVAAIIYSDDALLLVRHAKGDRSYWLLPGGGVEFGESLEAALIREVKEETNLDIGVCSLVMVADSIAPEGHKHVVNLHFLAEIRGGELECGAEPILAETQFVPLDKLGNLELHPAVQRELLEGIRHGFPQRLQYIQGRWV